ncbi:N-acetylmuramoyl-L-alanine amidase [Caldanaerobius polysaccharolyticus]|uniref:N-acetylmuramoyl-L-alanine amidase n=1 Tax=Caldanaerobius polysaccharolyticus TaxID=44256 RepID=UPI00068C1693|nr:N-acetylmuramoyl-L-alanine amidase [Caldanaerobius polysaccharolyticus]
MTMELSEMVESSGNYRNLSDIKWIVVHHSATSSGNVEIFRREHKARGWADVGYHYVITNGNGGPDGEVQAGRPLQMVGAHALGANQVSIGICLVGNFMETQPTDKQWKSLVNLCRSLMTRFNIPVDHVIGHKEVPSHFNVNYATDCPGKNFSISNLRKELSAKNPDYVGHWAEKAIKEVLDLGIMHGYADGSFRPDQPATRAELAVTVLNLYKMLKR